MKTTADRAEPVPAAACATPAGLQTHGLTGSGWILTVLCAGIFLAGALQAAERPNIVVIMADDLGYGDTGCYGAKTIPTPNIDRLAAGGTRFTRAYAPSSTCTPSRYAFLTGEYAWRQPPKKTSILDGDAPLAFDLSRPTLASFLQAQGYATALVGKWHLGLGDGITPVDFNGRIAPGPLEVGFDTAFFIPATVDRVPCVYIQDHRVAGLDPQDPLELSYQRRLGLDPVGWEHPELLRYPADRQHADIIINGISRIGSMSGGRKARWVDEEIADTLVNHAVKFIEGHKDRPFFLYLATHDPHVPRQPNPRFRGKSDAGVRGDAIVELDWMVGEVMATLERSGVAGNTLVIFTSDNGPVLFDGYFDGSVEANGSHTPAGGLRGWKYLRYEGGTRVPFVWRWPGHVPSGAVSADMISLQDVFATTAGLLNQPMPPGAGRDGLDLSALLFGHLPTQSREFIIEHGIGNVIALRLGNWKYLPKNSDAVTGIGSGADPRDQRFSAALVNEDRLYDLSVDPGEESNLAPTEKGMTDTLAGLMEKLRRNPEALVRDEASKITSPRSRYSND
jgi:arylsulfatase A-like enzyme